MSEDAPAPAEAIDGFESLYARHVGADEYRVLSLRNGSNTAHNVNVYDLTCPCKDSEYNKDEPEICDHLAVALYEAPKRIDVEDHAVNTLLELIRHGQLVPADNADQSEAQPTADTDASTEEPTDYSTGTADEDVMERSQEGVDGINDWLEPVISQYEHVSVYAAKHDGVDGVAIEPDNRAMSNTVYNSFKGIVKDLDCTQVHVGFGDDPCHVCGESDGEFWYFIANDDLSEVPGL